MPHLTIGDNGARVPERNVHGISAAMGLILALFGDSSVTEATRPRLIWDNVNPPDQDAPNGSVCICTAATSTEDVFWHREAGAWVKLSTLSDLLLPAVSDITIAAGVATLTGAAHTIRGASGAADDLDTISGMTATELAILVTGAEAITYRDFSVGGGNISTVRDASIVTATPAALSTPPLLACQESRWAPIMTISGFLSVPGISAMVL